MKKTHNKSITAVYAKSLNDVFGVEDALPWKCSADFRWFKHLTTGQVVIMGRATYDSLPNGALPNRVNIVITSDKDFKDDKVKMVRTFEGAVLLACRDYDELDLFVIGGATLFKKALPHCTGAYVSTVNTVVKPGYKHMVMAPILPPHKVDMSWPLKGTPQEILEGQPLVNVEKLTFTNPIPL